MIRKIKNLIRVEVLPENTAAERAASWSIIRRWLMRGVVVLIFFRWLVPA